MTDDALTAEHRARLGAIADELIPAGGGMPSATEAGATGRYLDEVLRSRPDLAAPLVAALDAVEGLEPGAAIARLRGDDADGWTVLTAVVPGAYFMNPECREAVGYPGLEARPIDPDAPPNYLEDGLLDSVRSRGPVFRPTP
jgi:hypothetical protein